MLALSFLVILTISLSIAGCGKKEDVVIEELEGPATTAQTFKPFNIYADARSPGNHYISSGWMGDFGDIKVNERWMKDPHNGTTCIRIDYNVLRSQNAGWIGIYWQNPANNWGQKKAGFDLTGARRLTFWARGENGNEIISEFKMGGIAGEFSDSDSAGIGPAMLTAEWRRFEIDLEGRDLTHIIGGFCLSANSDDNPNGFVIYLDDIRYE